MTSSSSVLGISSAYPRLPLLPDDDDEAGRLHLLPQHGIGAPSLGSPSPTAKLGIRFSASASTEAWTKASFRPSNLLVAFLIISTYILVNLAPTSYSTSVPNLSTARLLHHGQYESGGGHGTRALPTRPNRRVSASQVAYLKSLDWELYGRLHGFDWVHGQHGFITIVPPSSFRNHSSPSASAAQDDQKLDDRADLLEFPSHDILSDDYGNSLKPSRIVPHYYRASAVHETKDVTIMTVVSHNRLEKLVQLVEAYKGPMSVTLHISDDTDVKTRSALLSRLHECYQTSTYMSRYVSVHLVIDKFPRQFNFWRNIVKYYSVTDYVFMLDVDFFPATDFRSSILDHFSSVDGGIGKYTDLLDSGKAAFVMPAFQYRKPKEGHNVDAFPRTKEDLILEVQERSIDPFRRWEHEGHGATNYEKFYSNSDVYEVDYVNAAYEPWVVYKREGTPFCDERFSGYGVNKQACIFELFLSGVSLYVLPQDFIIHTTHNASIDLELRTSETRTNTRYLFLPFQREVCMRYLKRFHYEDGGLNRPVTRNLKKACGHFEEFRHYGSQSRKEERILEAQAMKVN